MKSLSLVKQLTVGFLISLFASISIYSLSLIFSYTDSFNISIGTASIFYIAFILKNSTVTKGRIITFVLMSVGVMTMCFTSMPSQQVIVISLLNILIARVIYCQPNWTASLFHAGLIAFGAFIASGVLMSTNSWFLSLWCFFFIQSFIVYQSDIFSSSSRHESDIEQTANKKFIQAKNSADTAIQHLSNLT